VVDHEDGDGDWQLRPGWGEHIAKGLGAAITSADEGALVPFLDEVEDLVAAGHEDMAMLIAQSGLYRSLVGRVTDKDFDVASLSDSAVLEQLLEQASTTKARSKLLARALGAVARIDVEDRAFERALSLFLLAASIWDEAGDEEKRAVALLRAGASAYQLDDPALGLECSDAAREIFLRLGDDDRVFASTLNLIHMASAVGDEEHAEALLEQARSFARGRRDAHITSSVKLEEAILRGTGGDHRRAGALFRDVYRSAIRRADIGQALIAARNLAVVASDQSATAREVRWYQVAVAHAQSLGDLREQQELERALGIALMRSDRFREGVEAFDRAIAINEEAGWAVDEAQARADKGAVLLQNSLVEGLSESEFNDLTRAAAQTLDQARIELEEVENFEWAAIAVRNLRIAWTLRKEESDGAAVLSDAADTVATDAEYYAEVRRNAAWLLLAAGATQEGDSRAVQWIIDAASTSNNVETAWTLAKEAAALADDGFTIEALSVYDAALALISPEEDPSAYGNMLNDSVVVMSTLEEFDDVRTRLLQVERIARNSRDRVLLSLALANLAETAIRADDTDSARAYLLECIEFATQLGDDAQAATALSKLSHTYLAEETQAEATRLSGQALEQALRSGSNDAWLHARSAVASAQYLVGDYEAAYSGWKACIDREDLEHSGEHQAFALDSLAAIGNWRRFDAEFTKFARRAQKTHTQFEFVEKLHLSALTWLRQGNPQAAGKVIAYGVMLAFEAASENYGDKGRVLSSAGQEQLLIRVTTALGAAHAVFDLLELPENKVQSVRKAFERTIHRVAGEYADEVLETVDRMINGQDESESQTS